MTERLRLVESVVQDCGYLQMFGCPVLKFKGDIEGMPAEPRSETHPGRVTPRGLVVARTWRVLEIFISDPGPLQLARTFGCSKDRF